MANDDWKEVSFAHGRWQVIESDNRPLEEEADKKVEPNELNIGLVSPDNNGQDQSADVKFYPTEIQIPADLYEGLLKYERLTGELLQDFVILVLRDALTAERIAGMQALLDEKEELLEKQHELLEKRDERIKELKTLRPGFWPRAFRRKA